MPLASSLSVRLCACCINRPCRPQAINSKTVSAEEFLREYRYSSLLSTHRHCLSVLGDDAVFRAKGYFIFATEYAPFGDLTSNVEVGRGLGEQHAKRVARQVGTFFLFHILYCVFVKVIVLCNLNLCY